MPRLYVFADESGDFNFSRNPRASKYFIMCTISVGSCDIGTDLLALRRQLIWDKADVDSFFHAAEDKQAIRDAVFTLIAQHRIVIDTTILEKCKAAPHIRSTDALFYQYAWYYHFRHIGARLLAPGTEPMIFMASVHTKAKQSAFTTGANSVVRQILGLNRGVTFFCPAAHDPCLQIADYCAWAIRRKWERNDLRSYNLVRQRIVSEYELFRLGKRNYY